MKTFCLRAATVALLLAPAAAFAVVPGTWTGPYVGVQAGVNKTSLNNFSSENAFTAGLRAGYNVQLSKHFVLGGDVFYEWNQDKDHQFCPPHALPCGSVSLGSNIYGVEALFGFPVGSANNFMPYLKLGYSHLNATLSCKGCGSGSGSDNKLRYGVGLEWALSNSLGLTFQYTYAKYGDNGDWENSNFTVGVNFHF